MKRSTPSAAYARAVRLAVLCAALVIIACKGESLLPTAPDPTPLPMPEPDAMPATVLATAAFKSANGYRTVGGARLEETEAGQRIVLEQDFETDESGALEVRLCTRKRCRDDDLVLGSLQSFRGEQSYAVDGDGTPYEFVVIWCAAVDLPFGTGRLL